MAASDSRPVPIKNTAYRVIFPILDADGDLVTGAASLDSEVSKDCGTFTDCTNEATEIATSSGVYYLDLTSTEMNADSVAVIVKTGTSGAKTTTIVLYPQESGDIKVDVQSYGGTAGTFSGGRPEVNTSHIAGSAVSTSTAQIGVNVVNFGGSAGTFASGRPEVNTTHAAGTAWGSGAITAASIASDAITAAKIADGAIDAATFAAGAINAAAIASDAITDAKVASDVTIASVTGSVGSVTGNVGGNVTGSVGSIAAGGIASTSFAAGAINAAAIAADAITDAKVASDVTIASVTGAVGSVTGNVGGNVTGSVGSVAAGGITAASIATGAIDADALAADAVAEIADGVWDEATSGHASAGTYGLAVSDILTDTAVIGAAGAGLSAIPWNAAWDAEVQSEVNDGLVAYDAATGTDVTNAAANVSVDEIQPSALADLFNTDSGTTYGSAVAGSVVAEIADNAGGSALTAAGIADAVWDEALSGHAGAGSAGEALAAAGTAGDPWTTSLPGSYSSGQAGYIIGTNLNATVSSRLASASYTAPLDAAGTRSAVGLASANLDTQLSTIDTVVDSILVDTAEIGTAGAGLTALATQASVNTIDDFLDTEIAAIKAKTDNLPAAPAASSDCITAAGVRTAVGLASANLDTQIGTLATSSALSTVAGYLDTEVAAILAAVDTEVGAIKAKTDNLPASPAAVSDIPTATQNADALLNRDMSAVSDTNARSPLNAFRFIRNKWSVSGTTLTVTKENDSTTAWTATLTQNAAADPVTGSDPA